MQALERISNYYSATANDSFACPTLSGDERADVAIVGGGFTGVAAALELAERGYDVVLLEAHRIGWGATGRNGGQVTGSLSGDAAIASQLRQTIGDDASAVMHWLRWHGHDIITRRIRMYNIQCDLRFGHLFAAYSPKAVDELQRTLIEAQDAGLGDKVSWLTREAVHEKLETPLYYGGILNHHNMHLHSLNLCLGEAAAARSLGVRIFEQSPVSEITYSASPSIRTPQGRVKANAVILAGNAYHRLARRQLQGLVFPAILGNMTTVPLDVQTQNKINPDNLAVYDSRTILDYYRMTADGRLMFGGGSNYSGRDIRHVAASLRPALERTFPALKGIDIEYAWSGAAGIVINRIPALGRISDHVYYAQGYSGHGIATSHILAELLAEAIDGTLERFDQFARLKRVRLPVGQRLGNALLALGMAYHRLKS